MSIEQWGGEVDFSNHEAKVPQNKAVILRFLLSECKVTTFLLYTKSLKVPFLQNPPQNFIFIIIYFLYIHFVIYGLH